MADNKIDPAGGEPVPQPEQAHTSEKGAVAEDFAPTAPYAADEEEVEPGTLQLPYGRKYKQLRIFGFTLPWYASPKFQLGMVAFVCFMCPGMYNALSGLGGGGKQDATLADNMVSAGR
jgi:hypothetical protein